MRARSARRGPLNRDTTAAGATAIQPSAPAGVDPVIRHKGARRTGETAGRTTKFRATVTVAEHRTRRHGAVAGRRLADLHAGRCRRRSRHGRQSCHSRRRPLHQHLRGRRSDLRLDGLGRSQPSPIFPLIHGPDGAKLSKAPWRPRRFRPIETWAILPAALRELPRCGSAGDTATMRSSPWRTGHRVVRSGRRGKIARPNGLRQAGQNLNGHYLNGHAPTPQRLARLEDDRCRRSPAEPTARPRSRRYDERDATAERWSAAVDRTSQHHRRSFSERAWYLVARASAWRWKTKRRRLLTDRSPSAGSDCLLPACSWIWQTCLTGRQGNPGSPQSAAFAERPRTVKLGARWRTAS